MRRLFVALFAWSVFALQFTLFMSDPTNTFMQACFAITFGMAIFITMLSSK